MPRVTEVTTDYSHLSDEELGQMLVSHGVNIGPINVATRKTYERKLHKLQTGQESAPTQHYEPVIEDDDDDDEVQLHVPPKRSSPRSTAASHPEPMQPRLRRDIQDTSSYRRDIPDTSSYRRDIPDTSSYTPRIESRAGLNTPRKMTSLYTESRAPSRPIQRTASPPSRESKGIPIWVKLIAILVIVVLVYLIYSNMEPQAVSNIPGVSQKVDV